MKRRSKEEIVTEINEVVDALRYYINQDGGDLEYIDYDLNSGIVTIKVLGACVGCAMIDVTYKDGVETILKSEVKEVKGVILEEENEDENK